MVRNFKFLIVLDSLKTSNGFLAEEWWDDINGEFLSSLPTLCRLHSDFSHTLFRVASERVIRGGQGIQTI